MKIAIIGGGNMGEAMLAGILARKLSPPQDISVSDIDDNRRKHLGQKYGLTVTSDNHQAATQGQVVVMAVKPQNLESVAAELKGLFESEQLVLSIIAGATIDTLSSGLRHNRIVRAMPNMPGQIGEGISVWTATDEVTGQQREWAGSILSAIGKEIYVDNEDYLNMATAVSGSGPAYFFLFIEALIEAAVQIGLPRNIARDLVLQTMSGSAHLIEKSDREPGELRRMVTSPGGTTAAALEQFEKGNFSGLIAKALNAACERARELGR
jgi:pyrroline-5-carboxylate reductase